MTGELDGHAGTIHGYRVSATLLPADAATARGREPEDEQRYKENNSRWVFLQVSPDKIKVALFEARRLAALEDTAEHTEERAALEHVDELARTLAILIQQIVE